MVTRFTGLLMMAEQVKVRFGQNVLVDGMTGIRAALNPQTGNYRPVEFETSTGVTTIPKLSQGSEPGNNTELAPELQEAHALGRTHILRGFET